MSRALDTFDEVYSNVSSNLKLQDPGMQQLVNLQNEIMTWRAVLQSSKYLSSLDYISVPKTIYGEFISGDLNDFMDNVVSKCKKLWDTIEKYKTTITDVKYDFLIAVRGKMMEYLLYVKGGDQE